ncbi:MAG: ribosome recycling factor [Flavobacteriales bacterium]|jgi:ribosome recycling factor|nr:ribosome recycling factor [Flavobacteriales bacterium]MBT6013900.1 ribosome recycling factor [Flavobacteriales bacterium]
MTEEIEFILDFAQEQMQESISRLEGVLSKIRAGKASPQMLSTVKVDYYGAITPLSQMANINTPDSQTISIQPFDKSVMGDIEKAITEANLGLNPMNNGEIIMINIPALTEERRKDLVKQVKLETENCKVSVRNTRQKANDEVKKLSKDGLSEDMARDAESSVQTLTDEYIALTDKHFEDKQKDVMTI